MKQSQPDPKRKISFQVDSSKFKRSKQASFPDVLFPGNAKTILFGSTFDPKCSSGCSSIIFKIWTTPSPSTIKSFRLIHKNQVSRAPRTPYTNSFDKKRILIKIIICKRLIGYDITEFILSTLTLNLLLELDTSVYNFRDWSTGSVWF